MKGIVLLCLVAALASGFARYSALVADEADAAVAPTAPNDPESNREPQSEPAPVAARPGGEIRDARTRDLLHQLEWKLDYLEMRQDEYVECAPSLGKVVRLTFSIDPPIEGVHPVSVVTGQQAYAVFGESQNADGGLAIAAGGDLRLIGARRSQLRVSFDASVRIRRGDGDSGRSNVQGSTVIGLGQRQELLAVGGSRLMLEATEIVVEEIRRARSE